MKIKWKLWKPGFQWNGRLEINFSKSWNSFFSIRILHTAALFSLSLLKFEKRFRKGYNKKTQLLYKMVVFSKQKKEL